MDIQYECLPHPQPPNMFLTKDSDLQKMFHIGVLRDPFGLNESENIQFGVGYKLPCLELVTYSNKLWVSLFQTSFIPSAIDPLLRAGITERERVRGERTRGKILSERDLVEVMRCVLHGPI